MKGDHPSGPDQTIPRLPVRAQSVIGMVAVDKDEIHRCFMVAREEPARVRAGRPEPSNLAPTHARNFGMGDRRLHAEAEAPDRKWIDTPQRPLGRHRRSQPTSRHPVPYTDLDQPAAIGGGSSQTVALGVAGLSLRTSETDKPQR